jgi:hypothetical protein
MSENFFLEVLAVVFKVLLEKPEFCSIQKQSGTAIINSSLPMHF